MNDPVYLLLLMCGATRAYFWLRALRPDDTENFARRHDESVWTCLRQILGTPNAPATAHILSTLAFSAGGLGLTSAVRVRPAAQWASWADSFRMVRQRHPAIAERMMAGLVGDDPIKQCRQAVLEAGLEVLLWHELADFPPPRDEEPEPTLPKVGWQQQATKKLEQKFSNAPCKSDCCLHPGSRPLNEFQSGIQPLSHRLHTRLLPAFLSASLIG